MELLQIGCVWVLLTCSFSVSENINLEFVLNVVTSRGSAGCNGIPCELLVITKCYFMSINISLVLIMYH